MPDKNQAAKPAAIELAPAVVAPPVRRHPGHRGADVRDTVAEMAAKAHEISMEAGSKMAAAMKDVINAAAGLTAFAIESSRDLVQYMVRRGQMTQEEADKLIREAEDSWSKKHKGKKPPARVHLVPGFKSDGSPAKPVAVPVTRAHAPAVTAKAKPAAHKAVPKAAAHKTAKPASRPAASKSSAKKKPAPAKSAPKKKPAAKK